MKSSTQRRNGGDDHEPRMVYGGSCEQLQRQYGHQRWNSEIARGRSDNNASASLPGTAAFLQSLAPLPEQRDLQRANSTNSIVTTSATRPEVATKDGQLNRSAFIPTLTFEGSGLSIPRSSSQGGDSLLHLRGVLKKLFVASIKSPPHQRHSCVDILASGSGSMRSRDHVAKKIFASYKLKNNASSNSKATQKHNILRRIDQDEKQADLAKEYQVSRAAISNMKQRRIRKEQRGGTFIGQHEELAVGGEHCEQVHTEEHDSAPSVRLFDSDQSYNHHQTDDSRYHHLSISEFTQSPLPVGSYNSESEELQDPASPP